jgi:MFS family permease
MAQPRSAQHWTWYLVGAATWFLSFGLSGVIVPALVTQELGLDARSLALAQMSLQIPTVALILVGGAVADRGDRRTLLIGLHCAAAMCAALLAFGVRSGALSLTLVAAYAAGLGVLSAFVLPARDALLSDVARGSLIRAVSFLTLAQWVMQAIGSLLGRLGTSVGLVPLIALQAAVLLAGVPAFARLPRRVRAADESARAIGLGELLEGVGEVVRSRVLGPVALLSMAIGTLFIGPFQVVFPLLVRDYYHGNMADLALVFATFPLGTITGSLFVLARGLKWKGAAQLGALGAGALCMGALGLGLPFWGALATVFLFGLGGALFVNAGRTLFQEHAPPAHRGRVLSVYTLATMGAAGILGAPLSSFLEGRFGPLGACTCAGALMLAVVASFLAFSDVRRLT